MIVFVKYAKPANKLLLYAPIPLIEQIEWQGVHFNKSL